ncbi:hypothetical protein M0804_015399 [Polistes exclamans]|nr:hypothetical protein M0804_015399 [Polistes exclamans]
MSTRDASRLTAATLKELLQRRGLSTCGTKAELIARLYDFDPSGEWVPNFSGDDVRSYVADGQTNEFGEAAGDDLMHDRRKMDFLRREKTVMEKKLEIVKRKLDLAHMLRQSSVSVQDEPAVQSPNARVGVKTIAEFLSYFDRKAEDFPGWKKQVITLRRTYRLNDDEARILVGMRLRDYYQDKIIKANWIPIEDIYELIDYLVKGIPDPTLRNQTRMQCFDEPELVLRAFEKLSLASGNYGDKTRGKPLQQTATTSVAGRGKAERRT